MSTSDRRRRHTHPAGEPWPHSFLFAFDPIACALFGIPPAVPGPPRSPTAAHRAPGEACAERYYVGRRSPDGQAQVFLVGARVEPMRHPRFRSDAQFAWGARDPGAHELAYAILNDALLAAPAEAVCRQFADEILARLQPDGFVLEGEAVLLWALAAIPEQAVSGGGAGTRRVRAGARIRSWFGRG